MSFFRESLLHFLICHNDKWLAWARTVDGYTIDEGLKFGCNHGIKHWLGVSKIAKDFTRRAGGTEHEIMLADIAGLLHDCGMIFGDKNHAENGALVAHDFLKELMNSRLVTLCYFGNKRPLSNQDIDIICHAIAQHSSCKDIHNIVDAAVFFADKTELGKHRIPGACYNAIQECEENINHVDFEITEETLEVYYDVDPDFNLQFFSSIWPKSYTAPQQVASWLGKELKIFVNNQCIVLPS